MSDRDSYDQYLLREPMTALASGQFNMSSDGKETITPIISSSSAGFVTPENPTGDAKVTTPNTVSSRTPSGSIDLGKTTLGTLSIYDYIESDDFVTGSTGWRISGNGDAEFSNATIRGSLSAVTIDIGGADATSFHVDIDGNMWSGAATLAAAPFQVSSSGAMTATSGTFSGTITSTSGTIGGFSIGSDYIRDAADSMGMASTVTGSDDVRFWAGDTYANRATADFRVTEAGAVTASSITITGGSVEGTTVVLIGTLNIAARGWTQTSVFSVTDADTVAWGAGTFTSADGTSYAIDAGNTGNMTVATYIYFDIAVSTTAYQTTTTAATAVGAGKVLITKAQNGTGEATFQVFGGIGGQNIDAANIVTGSITTNEIAASTIVGGNISSLSISGKTALFDTGTIGGFTMGATTLAATNLTMTSGAANTANISVGTGSNLAGMNSANAAGDITFWAGDTFANRATAPFHVTADGVVTAKLFAGSGSTVIIGAPTSLFQISSTNAATDTTLYGTYDNGVGTLILGSDGFLQWSAKTATANTPRGVIKIGSNIYTCVGGVTPVFYRYDTSLGTETLMTLSGSPPTTVANVRLATDGTNLYQIQYDTVATGASGGGEYIQKYTISGTTITYDSEVGIAGTGDWRQFYNDGTYHYLYKQNSDSIKRYTLAGAENTTYIWQGPGTATVTGYGIFRFANQFWIAEGSVSGYVFIRRLYLP